MACKFSYFVFRTVDKCFCATALGTYIVIQAKIFSNGTAIYNSSSVCLYSRELAYNSTVIGVRYLMFRGKVRNFNVGFDSGL